MKLDITWIIDFRGDSSTLNAYNQVLSNKWCKISAISEIIEGELTEEKLISYFENYRYNNLIKEFWDDAIFRNPDSINVFFLADNEAIYKASLFAYYLKSNSISFLNQIGLDRKNLKCFLISYWESSWSKLDEPKNTDSLFSLNLFQNIPDVKKRPFDFCFIFKNRNSGIEKYEYRVKENSNDYLNLNNYLNSKICSLIFHLSNCNEKIIRDNKLIDKWCVSFGAELIYLDAEALYNETSRELSNLILNELITQDINPWDLRAQDIVSEKLSPLKLQNVFSTIVHRGDTSNRPFYYMDLSVLWDWFGLSRLKSFFKDDLSQLLFKLKEGRVDFLFESYSQMRAQIEINYNKLIDFNQSNIRTPDVLFNDYFQEKPFSFQSYRLGLEKLSREIESIKKENLQSFNNHYIDPVSKERYTPCSMNPEVKLKFDDLCAELDDKDGLLLNQKIENQLVKIREKAEHIPHPFSLLIKTAFISSLLVMLTYIPLDLVLENWLITYCVLLLVFIAPFFFIWNTFRAKVRELYSLSTEFEALSKYYITRKLKDFIYRKIDAVYDEYQNSCQSELNKIEKKIKESRESLQSSITKDSKYPNALSVRSANSLASKIPPIKIKINESEFETKDLKGNREKLFEYFKQTVSSANLSLNDLLVDDLNNFNLIIISQLKSITDNIASASDLLFPISGVNIDEVSGKEILDLLPPFNNGLANIDSFSCEILLDAYRNNDDGLIRNFLFKGITPTITRFDNENSIELIAGAFSVVYINQPSSNLFGLFGTSLGGNKMSVVKLTEEFQKRNNDTFLNILEKVIYETITSYKFDSTQKREEVFKITMKGFDLEFDEDGWQTYINELESLDESYVKTFRSSFRDIFERILSKYLTENQN